MAMSNEDKKKLRSNHVRLMDDLELSEELFAVLIQHKILSADLKEQIEAGSTRRDKASKLMNILPRRGQRAFEALIEALCSSQQEELAEVLDPVICTKYKSDKDNNYDTDDEPNVVTKEPIQKTNLDEQILSKINEDDFNVTVLKMHQAEKQRFNSNAKDIYVINEPCGRALIIATERDEKKSLGVEIDARNLRFLFELLHFDTEVKLDLTSSEIVEVLEKEAKQQTQHCSAFILCVISYGSKNDVIYGNDKAPVKIEDIKSYFSGTKCPDLNGKPKLFFIHTGEPGENSDHYVDERFLQSDSDAADNSINHEKADILSILSTSDVWRDKLKGSWFIRCLVSIISHTARESSLQEIILKVNALCRKAGIQPPEKRSTLLKKFHFIP